MPHPRRFRLGRRAVLRGIAGGSAVAVGLPLLEAMLDAHGEALADGTKLPRQLVTWLGANGFLLSELEPTMMGSDWELTAPLAPLARHKAYLNLCTGLENRGIVDGTLYGHFEGLTAFSGYPMERNPSFDAGGPTLDQVVADHIDAQAPTPVRSIQVGISKAMSLEGSGNLGHAFSFRGSPGALTPLPPQFSPRGVWQTLFGFLPTAGEDEDRVLRGSMLDVVRDQAQRLRPRLGAGDRQRLDAHLQGVRELEVKLGALPPACDRPGEPAEENGAPLGEEAITEVTHLMAELIAVALRCDITRVASVQLLGLAGETQWTEAGVAGTHHANSHDAQTIPEALAAYRAGILYQIERLADFVTALADTVDVRGQTLLDSAVVLASSDCSVGWMHSIARHPILLIGTGGGHLRYPGVHAQAVANDPSDPDGYGTAYLPTAGNTSDVLLSVLRAFDSGASGVGAGDARSTTPLPHILA